jgi:membrane-bound inhibitor of C-type lysozyme
MVSTEVLRPLGACARFAIAALGAVALLAACENPMKKKEEELAKNTFACQLSGERFVVRFVEGEARILMPGAQRVTLYQLPSTSGVRYSNGTLELRGRGTELQIIADGVTTPLKDCEPYAVLPPAK